MKGRYQTTTVEASTLLNRLWCRNCGGPLLTELPFDVPGLVGEFNLNLMMSCVRCMVPDRDLRPDAGRIADRLLYHLIIEGVARVRITTSKKGPWIPPKDLIIHEKTIESNSARSYFSEAARNIPGIWVATHLRLNRTRSSYVLGHLKLTGTPCSCKLE